MQRKSQQNKQASRLLPPSQPLLKQPILDLKKTLQSSLKGAKRVAILGVGSDLRGDDIAGMLAAEAIAKSATPPSKSGVLMWRTKKTYVQVFLGSTAPENYTGAIKKFKPTHLFIIDAADTSSKPGTISLIDPNIVAGISFSTHMLPLKIMVDYMLESMVCQALVIGIQPKNITFGSKPCKEVLHSAKVVAKTLLSII